MYYFGELDLNFLDKYFLAFQNLLLKIFRLEITDGQDEEKNTYLKLNLFFYAFASLVTLIFMLSEFFLQNAMLSFKANLCFFVFMLVGARWIKRKKEYEKIGIITILLYVVDISVTGYELGIYSYAAVFWLCITPSFGYLLGGTKVGDCGFLFALLALIFLAFIDFYFPSPKLMPNLHPHDFVINSAIEVISALIVNFLAIRKFHRANVQMTSEAKQAKNKVKELFDQLNLGVFTLSNNLKIENDYSAFLEKILCRENLCGLDFCSYLFSNASYASDAIAQSESSLMATFGEGKEAYAFNKHLLLKEITIFEKFIEIDWIPLFDEAQCLVKYLVIMRDLTEYKAIEKQAKNHKVELQCIDELLNIGLDSFRAFYLSCLQMLEEIYGLLEQNFDEKKKIIIFNLIHTIKGTSRVLGLNLILNEVFAVENYLHSMKNRGLVKKTLLENINSVKSKLEYYDNIWNKRLKQLHAESNWYLKAIDFEINRAEAHSQADHPLFMQNILRIKKYKNLCSLEFILKDVILNLNQIAASLNKHPPKILFLQTFILWNRSQATFLQQVFSHIFSNALAHGIETQEIRLKNNKAKEGQITIGLNEDEENIYCTVFDDGQGLDLEEFQKRANKESMDKKEIEAMMFSPGFSTTLNANQISGYGIGLNAVRTILACHNATISIEFTRESNAKYQPFKFVMKLEKYKFL